MTRLCHIIAIEADAKAQAGRVLTDAHHTAQKQPLLTGIARTYEPKDEDGDQLPAEYNPVQVKVDNLLADVRTNLGRTFDLVATREAANAEAKADVVVDGVTVLEAVPVGFLLYLERMLTDLYTFMRKLPALDAGKKWTYDPAVGHWATDPVKTTRTRKTKQNHIKYEATEHHPAQVETFDADVIVGYWTTVSYSGALPADRVDELAGRVAKLRTAVRVAREEANTMRVTELRLADRIFEYLLTNSGGEDSPE